MTNIKSIRPIGKAQTYDLEVAHPDHQYYLSNGMLTSNSHATLYSMISFHTAYLKANYPIEFLVANLMNEVHSNAKQSKDNILKIKSEIRAKKVKIVPPDVNTSGRSWKIVDDHTLMTGLDSLKYMGKDAIPDIIAKRPFTSFQDLIFRTDASKVRSPSISAMAASGSLDSFDLDRKVMFYYASDYRAKLRNHMQKLERQWVKDLEKKEVELDADAATHNLEIQEMLAEQSFGTPPQEMVKKHLEEFNYPFPDEKPWTIQERYAFEEFYIGEGISGDIFDRYPKFFDREKTIPFEALKQMFPWEHHDDDERKNRKANTHYLGNHKIRPIEAVLTTMFVFTVKKEDSPIFGQEMARFTIQDPWGDESSLLCFPEAWEAFKERVKSLSGNKQDIEPGLAIRFLGLFQWDNEATTSFVLNDILSFKAPPSLPEDRSSRKVKMPRSKKVTAAEAVQLTKEELQEKLEIEALEGALGTVDDEDDAEDGFSFR